MLVRRLATRLRVLYLLSVLQNAALQKDILVLQDSIRRQASSVEDGGDGGTAGAAQGKGWSTVLAANVEAEVRKARNEIEFLKHQVRGAL